MMKIIIYDEITGSANIDPHLANIKEFKKLLKRNDSEEWLSYIYLYCRHDSPYAGYEDEDKHEMICNDIFGEVKELDQDIVNGICRFEKLYETPLVRLLKGAQNALQELTNYFNTISFTSKDSRGGLLHQPKDVITVLGKLGTTVENINKLQQQVEKELGDVTQTRGGVEVGKYNK